MKSDTISISNKDSFENVLAKTEEFSKNLGLGKKQAFYLRIIVEETLGMFGNMVGEYKANVSLEGDNNAVKLLLEATTDMDIDKKKELIDVSTTGKNSLAKGFMSKIGDMIENGFLYIDGASQLQNAYGNSMINYGYGAAGVQSAAPVTDAPQVWSLNQYREGLIENGPEDEFEDLEKSIVAKLATEITVGVKKDRVVLEITKNF